MTPLILGFVLGYIMSLTLRRSLSYSMGDFSVFFTRPMSCTFLVLAAVSIIVNLYVVYRGRKKEAQEAK